MLYSKGYLKALFKNGIRLIKGDETIKDENKGIQYIKMAAEEGYKDALYYCYSMELNKGNADGEKLFQLLKI